MPERRIFRQSAITAYRRGMERDVVPRLITWPIIACMWLLLGAFIVAGLLAWNVEVPTYADGTGVILNEANVLQPAGGPAAVMFLPADQVEHVRVGLPADVEIGLAGMHARGKITKVDAGIMSPETARRIYGLDGASSLLITEPSVVVTVELDAQLPATAYAGSVVTARVEIGSQRLLTLLPGLGKLL